MGGRRKRDTSSDWKTTTTRTTMRTTKYNQPTTPTPIDWTAYLDDTGANCHGANNFEWDDNTKTCQCASSTEVHGTTKCYRCFLFFYFYNF